MRDEPLPVRREIGFERGENRCQNPAYTRALHCVFSSLNFLTNGPSAFGPQQLNRFFQLFSILLEVYPPWWAFPRFTSL